MSGSSNGFGDYYLIQNTFSGLYIKSPADAGQPVTMTNNNNDDSAQWILTKKQGGQYVFKNKKYSALCATVQRAQSGSKVIVQTKEKGFNVQEGNNVGEYTVSPVDESFYWGLEGSDNPGDPVTLSDNIRSKLNQWAFVAVRTKSPL